MSKVSFLLFFFFFSSRRRHTRYIGDWSSDVCSSDLRSGRNYNGVGVNHLRIFSLLTLALGLAPPPQPAEWTAADDHRNMMEQLGIREIGRASCRERV